MVAPRLDALLEGQSFPVACPVYDGHVRPDIYLGDPGAAGLECGLLRRCAATSARKEKKQ